MPRILAPAGQFIGIVLGLILGFKFGRKPVEISEKSFADPQPVASARNTGTPDDW